MLRDRSLSVEVLLKERTKKPTKKKAKVGNEGIAVEVCIQKPSPPLAVVEVSRAAGDSSSEEAEGEYDPYEVHDDYYRYVDQAEYDHAINLHHIHPSIKCDFDAYVSISRRSYLSGKVTNPEEFYTHDPTLLIDALTIACNIEAAAKRAASLVPYDALHIVENNDTASEVEAMAVDAGAMLPAVRARGEEFLFALMAVENATRHPPDSIAPLLLDSK
jgi:hypothetical protein